MMYIDIIDTCRAECRCRHYMIDQLPNGRFVVVGEPKVHRSLVDLVTFYRTVSAPGLVPPSI